MPKIIQYHPSVISADGIGNSIMLLHEGLLAHGMESYVACADSEYSKAAPGVLPISGILQGLMGCSFSETDTLLIHFSFFDPIAERLSQLPIRRILVYHNITPGHFFREVGLGWLADACDQGRGQLQQLAEQIDVAVGDSDFNSTELRHVGFRQVSTIPVLFDISLYRDGAIDPKLFQEIRASADVNVLFVGRFVPNKRIERLIAMVATFKNSFPRSIHLHLVGKIWDENYFASLMRFAGEQGVAGNLRLHLSADPVRLQTLYAAADAFVCMSDHEGFMVPIVEAFASGCPVIASKEAAIGETMGGAGLLMSSPDPKLAAGLVHLLTADREMRNGIIADQARRAMAFRLTRTTKRWIDTILAVSAA